MMSEQQSLFAYDVANDILPYMITEDNVAADQVQSTFLQKSSKWFNEPLDVVQERIDAIFGNNNSDDHQGNTAINNVITHAVVSPVTIGELQCLRPRGWLTDSVMNPYMTLLKNRDIALWDYVQSHPQRAVTGTFFNMFKPSWFFNTFFMVTLCCGDETFNNSSVNVEAVRKWTKREICHVWDVASIYIPVNQDNTHWFLVVMHVETKRVSVYSVVDPFSSRVFAYKILASLMAWLAVEVQRSLPGENGPPPQPPAGFLDGWKAEVVAMDRQTNGYDCGVFTLYCADLLSSNFPVTYVTQDNIDSQQVRRQIAAALLEQHL